MSTNFPTSLDSYATLVDNVDDVLAAHPNNRGDAIEAIEAKVGVDGSAVTTSHDFLVTNLPVQDVDVDFGPHEFRARTLNADIATGTAPLVIASTTVVANLNVDQVDGLDSTDIVQMTGNQTVAGIKTFSSIPVLPASDPSASNEAARKLFVDNMGQTSGGDLSGTYPNPTVAKIQTRAMASTAPTDQQVIGWDSGGSTWKPLDAPGGAFIFVETLTLSGTSQVSATLPTNADLFKLFFQDVHGTTSSVQIRLRVNALVASYDTTTIADEVVASEVNKTGFMLGVTVNDSSLMGEVILMRTGHDANNYPIRMMLAGGRRGQTIGVAGEQNSIGTAAVTTFTIVSRNTSDSGAGGTLSGKVHVYKLGKQ